MMRFSFPSPKTPVTVSCTLFKEVVGKRNEAITPGFDSPPPLLRPRDAGEDKKEFERLELLE